MERKKIENLIEYCDSIDHCSDCSCKNLCDEIENKISSSGLNAFISRLPTYWNDRAIDDILDEINKEE